MLRPHFYLDGSPNAMVRVNLLQPGDPLEWNNSSNRSGSRTYSRKAKEFEPELFKGAVIAQGDKDRLRRYRQDNPDRTVLWVKKGDAVEHYGIEEVVDLATIEPLKLPRQSKRGGAGLKKTDIRIFSKFRMIDPNFDLDQEAIYIPSEGPKYKILGEVLDYDEAWNKFARHLPGHLSVVVLMKNQRSLVGDNWRHIDDVLKEMCSGFDVKAYARAREVQRFVNNTLVYELDKRRDKLPKRLQKFFEDLDDETEFHEPPINLELWRNVTGKSLPPLKDDLRNRFNKLTARYPLLELVRHNDEHLDHYLNLIRR